MTNSVTASVSAASIPASAERAKSLVKLANGEYTAASVAADPKDAAKLGLTKEKDGNYGVGKTSQIEPAASATSSASSGVQAALTKLTLGGA